MNDFYAETGPLSEGMRRVMVYDKLTWKYPSEFVIITDKLYWFIDQNGNEIGKAQWTNAWDFRMARACVYNPNGYGFIDLGGFLIIPNIYEDICPDFEYQFQFHAIIGVKHNGKWGIIDILNNIKTPFEYESIELYEDPPDNIAGFVVDSSGHNRNFTIQGILS